MGELDSKENSNYKNNFSTVTNTIDKQDFPPKNKLNSNQWKFLDGNVYLAKWIILMHLA